MWKQRKDGIPIRCASGGCYWSIYISKNLIIKYEMSNIYSEEKIQGTSFTTLHFQLCKSTVVYLFNPVIFDYCTFFFCSKLTAFLLRGSQESVMHIYSLNIGLKHLLVQYIICQTKEKYASLHQNIITTCSLCVLFNFSHGKKKKKPVCT